MYTRYASQTLFAFRFANDHACRSTISETCGLLLPRKWWTVVASATPATSSASSTPYPPSTRTTAAWIWCRLTHEAHVEYVVVVAFGEIGEIRSRVGEVIAMKAESY